MICRSSHCLHGLIAIKCDLASAAHGRVKVDGPREVNPALQGRDVTENCEELLRERLTRPFRAETTAMSHRAASSWLIPPFSAAAMATIP